VILYDWGSREWHKIAIRRCDSGPCTLVTIRKDSWTWIIGTLIIRFVGVFVVLVVIMIMLIVSGRIFSSADTKKGKEKPQPVVAK